MVCRLTGGQPAIPVSRISVGLVDPAPKPPAGKLGVSQERRGDTCVQIVPRCGKSTERFDADAMLSAAPLNCGHRSLHGRSECSGKGGLLTGERDESRGPERTLEVLETEVVTNDPEVLLADVQIAT